MNVGICIEIAVNFVQQLMFIGFLYLFFEKGENKLKNGLAFWGSVFFLFTMSNYFTFKGLTFNHLDSIIITIVMLLYSVFFLKGDLFLRVIMPIVAFSLNMLIAYLNLSVMIKFGNKSFLDALTFSTSFRYLYIITSNLIYAVAVLVILRIGKKKIKVCNITEIVSFFIIAVIV